MSETMSEVAGERGVLQVVGPDAENLFEGVVEQSLTGIYVIQDGRFVYVNPKFGEIFGYTPAEVLAFYDEFGRGMDGMQLLEDLRHHKLITLSTMFFMVTAEGNYSKVVSAAELAQLGTRAGFGHVRISRHFPYRLCLLGHVSSTAESVQ